MLQRTLPVTYTRVDLKWHSKAFVCMKEIPPLGETWVKRELRFSSAEPRLSRLNIWYWNVIHHASRVCLKEFLKDERVSWVSISRAALSFTKKRKNEKNNKTEWKTHKSGKALKKHLVIFNSFPHIKKLLGSSEMHVQLRFMHFSLWLSLDEQEAVPWEWQRARTMDGFLMEAADKLLASHRIALASPRLASTSNGFSWFISGKMSIFGNVIRHSTELDALFDYNYLMNFQCRCRR